MRYLTLLLLFFWATPCFSQEVVVFRKPAENFAIGLFKPWHLFPSNVAPGFYEFINDRGDVVGITIRKPDQHRRKLLNGIRTGKITKSDLEASIPNVEANTNKRRLVFDTITISNQIALFQGYVWPHESIGQTSYHNIWSFAFLFKGREYIVECTGRGQKSEEAAISNFKKTWDTDFKKIMLTFFVIE